MSHQERIQSLIREKKLRPLGNRARLTQTSDQYSARLFLFPAKKDAELYYRTFVEYAGNNPPPFAFEIICGRIHTIFDEPFGVVFPYERTEERPGYSEWFRQAVLTCNERIRNFRATDHSYAMLGRYIKELFHWTILVPAGLDPDSEAGLAVFSDPPDGGYPPAAAQVE